MTKQFKINLNFLFNLLFFILSYFVQVIMVLSFSEIVEMQPHNRGFEAPPVFTEGEKVFAFHQNMLYEAKVFLKTFFFFFLLE